ncbi:DNA-binding protein D-ETS-3-like [Colias croceus]|uniref:DNA-binding protein D-ETS-3-like n=1 Tax=Colias crocea TaxID=72248 RepID=UPI001E27E7AC|nr:DNA-binding protein D-ETS-3-like [Colias croceus]
MRIDVRGLKCATALRAVKVAMYESSCSYSGALELKRSSLKEEPWPATEWPPYRLHQSTFEQLKQSVEKAKAALQDRSGLLGTATAFGDFYGGQLGQDGTSTIGFGRTSRTEESMLGSVDKNKGLGTEKLSSGLSKGYSTSSLSDSLRSTKCSVISPQ